MIFKSHLDRFPLKRKKEKKKKEKKKRVSIFGLERVISRDLIVNSFFPSKKGKKKEKRWKDEEEEREARSVCIKNFCGDTIYFRTCSVRAVSDRVPPVGCAKFNEYDEGHGTTLRAVPFKRTRTNLVRIALRRLRF